MEKRQRERFMERAAGGVDSPANPLLVDVFSVEASEGKIRGRGGGWIAEEVKKQLWLGGPLVATNLLQYLLQMISIMVVGHQGELALSSVSIASSFSLITGLSLLIGLSGGLGTLCGQSYGAKVERMLGIHTQRAMVVLLILCFPISILWINASSILVFIGQDAVIAQTSGSYVAFLIPGLFGFAILHCLNNFFTSQNRVFPLMLCSGLTTLLHVPVCWGLVSKSGLGIRGAAVATSFSLWVNVVLLSLYVKFSPSCAKTWTGFSREALENVMVFLRLAVPSAFMVCLSIWSSETVVFLSGLLPNPVLETSVISTCLGISTVIRMVPFASACVVSVRVSNELGAGNPDNAKRAIRVCLAITLFVCVLSELVLLVTRDTLGYTYSNESEVAEYVATMVPLLVISNLLDGLQAVLSGVLGGSGWQKIGAYVTLGSYYLVGIPTSILFGFVLGVGGRGIWLGAICATFAQVSAIAFVMTRTNWTEEVKKAKGRVYESIIPETE
ncbi:PREDICTED: protein DETOXIFICATION 16-like [Camelina sativa]|uniref:Protein DETOXIFICATION n=1 Tax=Camelina sativa TaxID=90675 RepID=A0ABM0TLX9_CAMSA|nr:PREDICTED: protein DETOXIFICATION 16-like [Camelina sativa]